MWILYSYPFSCVYDEKSKLLTSAIWSGFVRPGHINRWIFFAASTAKSLQKS